MTESGNLQGILYQHSRLINTANVGDLYSGTALRI